MSVDDAAAGNRQTTHPIRHLYIVSALVTVLTALVVACFSRPAAASTPLGGSGTVTARGQVGVLHIDSSTRNDVVQFAGQPAAEQIDTIHVPPFPYFDALGYFCTQHARRLVGITVEPVNHVNGPYCHTVFYINTRTGLLAGFWTASWRYSTPSGVRPGMSAQKAESRVHRMATAGCQIGIWLAERGVAGFHISVAGGRQELRPGPHGSTFTQLLGGHISGFQVESNRNPVGLLFC
jgi:hypothetical protein